MSAMGIWTYGEPRHRAYFSETWNVLDFVIVCCGLLDLLGIGGAGLTLLRALRVLRPLRAINRLPGLRILVSLVLVRRNPSSLPPACPSGLPSGS